MRATAIVILALTVIAVACSTRTPIGSLGDASVSSGGQSGTGGHDVTGGTVGTTTGGTGAAGAIGDSGSGGMIGGGSGGGGGCTTARDGGAPGRLLAFASLRTYLAGPHPRLMNLGDLNGDGKIDMVVGNLPGVTVLFNDGNAAFLTMVSYLPGVQPQGLRLGDLNGDGKLDLVVATFSAVTVLLNDGQGAFASPVSYAVSATSIACGDLNGDGQSDLVVGNSDSNISVLTNTGKRTFALDTLPSSMGATSVSIADIDGDGRPDILSSGATVFFGIGTNLGGFSAPVTFASGAGDPPVTGDLNGDCKLDIVAGGAVLLNSGGRRFAAGVIYDFQADPSMPVWTGALGDFDGDGAPDLAVTHPADPQDGLGILLNDGTGVFARSFTLPTGPNPNSIAVGDLNGDGKLDIAAAYESGVDVLVNASH